MADMISVSYDFSSLFKLFSSYTFSFSFVLFTQGIINDHRALIQEMRKNDNFQFLFFFCSVFQNPEKVSSVCFCSVCMLSE